MQDGSTETDTVMHWKVLAESFTVDGRIYVPEALCNQALGFFNDIPVSSHVGALRTAEHVSNDLCWLELDTTVQKYITRCDIWHWINAPRQAQYGANMLQPPLYNCWNGIKIDFITDLTELTKSGYTTIMVIVDQWTKIEIYPPFPKDIDTPGLLSMYCNHENYNRGKQSIVVSDYSTQFISQFWTQVCSHISIQHHLSSAFHPQTHSQTEWPNQTIYQYLWAITNDEHDNSTKLHSLVDFAYNNSLHDLTKLTPLWAMAHVSSEPWDAVQSTESITSKDREPSRNYACGIGRDSSYSLGKHTGSPATTDEVHLR